MKKIFYVCFILCFVCYSNVALSKENKFSKFNGVKIDKHAATKYCDFQKPIGILFDKSLGEETLDKVNSMVEYINYVAQKEVFYTAITIKDKIYLNNLDDIEITVNSCAFIFKQYKSLCTYEDTAFRMTATYLFRDSDFFVFPLVSVCINEKIKNARVDMALENAIIYAIISLIGYKENEVEKDSVIYPFEKSDIPFWARRLTDKDVKILRTIVKEK